MSKFKKKSGEAISLFPLLILLTCTIGTLVLGIFTLSIGNTAIDYQQRRQKLLEDKSRELLDKREALERLTQLIGEAEKDERALAQARTELDRLEREQVDAQKNRLAYLNLKAEDEKLQERIKDLDILSKSKGSETEQLREALKVVKRPKEKKIMVTGVPGDGREDLIPYFVDCASDVLVIYEEADKTRILKGDLPTSKTFKTFLSRISSQQKGILIFLIRPDGVSLYDRAVRIANEQKVKNGKLPLPGYGELDLTSFKATRK